MFLAQEPEQLPFHLGRSPGIGAPAVFALKPTPAIDFIGHTAAKEFRSRSIRPSLRSRHAAAQPCDTSAGGVSAGASFADGSS